VAEVYVGNSHASVPRPVKELKAFAKVDQTQGRRNASWSDWIGGHFPFSM
jgi:hypothetical protein